METVRSILTLCEIGVIINILCIKISHILQRNNFYLVYVPMYVYYFLNKKFDRLHCKNKGEQVYLETRIEYTYILTFCWHFAYAYMHRYACTYVHTYYVHMLIIYNIKCDLPFYGQKTFNPPNQEEL